MSVALSAVNIPILRRIGPIPFWTQGEECFPFMERIYGNVSRTAMNLAYWPGGLQARSR